MFHRKQHQEAPYRSQAVFASPLNRAINSPLPLVFGSIFISTIGWNVQYILLLLDAFHLDILALLVRGHSRVLLLFALIPYPVRLREFPLGLETHGFHLHAVPIALAVDFVRLP